MRASKYPRLGEDPKEKDPSGVFCFIVSEHLPYIDPSRYFITTGEAIEKVDKLIEDGLEYVKRARKLKRLLLNARGDSKYLETGWEDGIIVLKQKNLRKPRKKKAAKKRPQGRGRRI